MPTIWKTAAAAALREQSPAKIPDLCAAAREKIYKRILLRGSRGSWSQEKEDLNQALQQLVLHELKKTTPALPPQPDPAQDGQLTQREGSGAN